MGKHGPCYHCGVTSTPLWRNGPPEKPVLCNACGSRWRTKGTLANYTPLHSRPEYDEFEDSTFSNVKKLSSKKKVTKFLKRKFDSDPAEFGVGPLDYNQIFRKSFDEDTSNRSSSGSVISNTESCAQYGSADACDFTGPHQPSVWDSTVPSRKKRTCVGRPKKPSPVEKLTKDLYTLWQEQQSSCLSEEELLLESDKPMISVEIGHGSVLISHPCSITREEESEASSISIDNKQHTVNSWQVVNPGLVGDTYASLSNRGIGKIKKPANRAPEQEQIRRDKDQLEELPVLVHHDSPLCDIDLQELLNFETFATHLTNDEQHLLLKLLPLVDTLEAPSSLKDMFGSPQFKENLLSFQKLLADGVFDNSFCGVNSEDCRILKKLILRDSTKSKWVDQYTLYKDSKRNPSYELEVVGGFNALETVHSVSMKRSRDGLHKNFAGSKFIMETPRRNIVESSYGGEEIIDNGGSFLNAKSQFSLQSDSGIYSFHFDGDDDLLLDVPSNGSFPQAELLQASSFGALASDNSCSVGANLIRQ